MTERADFLARYAGRQGGKGSVTSGRKCRVSLWDKRNGAHVIPRNTIVEDGRRLKGAMLKLN
jgi:hypothetical protein